MEELTEAMINTEPWLIDITKYLSKQYPELITQYVPDGIQLSVPKLPYIFEVSFLNKIGWKLFLISRTNEYPCNEETDGIYEALDKTIEKTNWKHYRFYKASSLF